MFNDINKIKIIESGEIMNNELYENIKINFININNLNNKLNWDDLSTNLDLTKNIHLNSRESLLSLLNNKKVFVKIIKVLKIIYYLMEVTKTFIIQKMKYIIYAIY